MPKLILPSKSYLILLGLHPELEKVLERMSERIGFRALICRTESEYAEDIKRVKSVAGVVVSMERRPPPAFEFGPREPLFIAPDEPLETVLERLDQYLLAPIPKDLVALTENAILKIAPMVLGEPPHKIRRNLDCMLRFSHLVSCDTAADGFSAKSACEIDFGAVRKNYPKVTSLSDRQLTDAFGELCNQVLGIVNEGLRPTGLLPRIALPIAAELNEKSLVAQVNYMPMLRFTDESRSMAISLAVKIAPNCPARWQEISVNPKSSDVEFF